MVRSIAAFPPRRGASFPTIDRGKRPATSAPGQDGPRNIGVGWIVWRLMQPCGSPCDACRQQIARVVSFDESMLLAHEALGWSTAKERSHGGRIATEGHPCVRRAIASGIRSAESTARRSAARIDPSSGAARPWPDGRMGNALAAKSRHHEIKPFLPSWQFEPLGITCCPRHVGKALDMRCG